MAHDYETSKKLALKVISILGLITIGEVLFALFGKGHLIEGFTIPTFTIPLPFVDWGIPFNIVAIVMITMSLIKAFLIIFEFMHMKYELNGLAKSVLLPTFLLVWGVIAFLYEGNDWGNRRELINDKNKEKIEEVGFLRDYTPIDIIEEYTI
ncbi:MAG: cytochrome C oxidase subunit IV family protein [Saprospiraceae bacterium]